MAFNRAEWRKQIHVVNPKKVRIKAVFYFTIFNDFGCLLFFPHIVVFRI